MTSLDSAQTRIPFPPPAKPKPKDDKSKILTAEDFWAPQAQVEWIIPELKFAAGTPTALVAPGYLGKTMVAMSLGMSVALDRAVWGTSWKPTRRGRVLHLDSEMGSSLVSERVRRLATGFKIGQSELEGWYEAISFPRWNLTSKDAYDQLCYYFEGHSVVILDSLKALTPGVDENSSAMRDYVSLLSQASAATGAAPLLIHHEGKPPLQGRRSRRNTGRGSSAIFDECQGWFVMSGEKGRPALVSHEKERVRGKTISDFTLEIVDVARNGNPYAGLGVVCKPSTAPPQSSGNEDVAALALKVLDLLVPVFPEGMSKKRISRELQVRPTSVDVAIETLGARITANGLRGAASRVYAQKAAND